MYFLHQVLFFKLTCSGEEDAGCDSIHHFSKSIINQIEIRRQSLFGHVWIRATMNLFPFFLEEQKLLVDWSVGQKEHCSRRLVDCNPRLYCHVLLWDKTLPSPSKPYPCGHFLTVLSNSTVKNVGCRVVWWFALLPHTRKYLVWSLHGLYTLLWLPPTVQKHAS